jgi:uncharacterized protein
MRQLPHRSEFQQKKLQTLQTKAEQGDVGAQETLGWMYANGLGLPLDYAKARQWCEKAAAQGNAMAQLILGALYEEGRGVPKDLVQAYLWLSMAAAQGNKNAAQALEKAVVEMTSPQIAEAQRLSKQCKAQNFKGC